MAGVFHMVPTYRCGGSLEMLSPRAWGSGSIRGERSVANNDEDTITWYITDFRWGSPQAAAVAVLGKELGYP